MSKQYPHISGRSNFSDQSTTLSTTTELSYPNKFIIPAPKISTAGKVSQPMIPSTSPSQQQYVYYDIEDHHLNKEGYVCLTAGESEEEVSDKSDSKEWVIASVGKEARPSKGLVSAEVLSAEYVPVCYNSSQGEYSSNDEGRLSIFVLLIQLTCVV